MSNESLSRTQEFELIKRAQSNDHEALTTLLAMFADPIKELAMDRVRAYCVPTRLHDLLLVEVEQVGRLRLINAIQRKFDATRGTRLWTYAGPTIRGAMNDYLEKEQRQCCRPKTIDSSDSDEHDSSTPLVFSSQSSSCEDAVAAVDWQNLQLNFSGLVESQANVKFLVLSICIEGERISWQNFVDMLNTPLEPLNFQWRRLHSDYKLGNTVPDSWSRICNLFANGQPQLSSDKKQAANTLLKWYSRQRTATRMTYIRPEDGNCTTIQAAVIKAAMKHTKPSQLGQVGRTDAEKEHLAEPLDLSDRFPQHGVSTFIGRLLDQVDPHRPQIPPAVRHAQLMCGRWLALHRIRQGLELFMIAEQIGIDQRALLFLESGLADPTLAAAYLWTELAQVLADEHYDEDQIHAIIIIALGAATVEGYEFLQQVLADLRGM